LVHNPQPLLPESFLGRFVTIESYRFNLTHEMSMMVAVGIVEAENPAIVALANRVVDVRKIVSGHHGLALFDIPPYLITQNPTA
jgi:hypothetical protein